MSIFPQFFCLELRKKIPVFQVVLSLRRVRRNDSAILSSSQFSISDSEDKEKIILRLGRNPATNQNYSSAIHDDLKKRIKTLVARLTDRECDIEGEIDKATNWLSNRHSLWGLFLDELQNLPEASLLAFQTMEKQSWYKPHPRWYTRLIKTMANSGKVEEAELLFRSMKCERNTQAYNALILAYLRSGMASEAFSLVNEMKQSPLCKPDLKTYHVILEDFSRKGDIVSAENCMKELVSEGFKPDLLMYNVMMSGYFWQKMWDKMEIVFSQLRAENLTPNSVTMSLLVNAYISSRQMGKLQSLVHFCAQNKIRFSATSSSRLISALAKANNFEAAEKVFAGLGLDDSEDNMMIFNTLLSAYAESGNVRRLESLFQEVKLDESRKQKLTVVTYTSCLKAYLNSGLVEKAISTLDEMKILGFTPDIFTFGIVFGACNPRKVQHVAEEFLREVCEEAWPQSESLYSILKKACLYAEPWNRAKLRRRKYDWPSNEEWVSALSKFRNPDVAPGPGDSRRPYFNTVIKVFVDARSPRKILECLRTMRHVDVFPDLMTFNLLLGLCSRGRQPQVAVSIFSIMTDLGFKPDIYTFNSMLASEWKSGILPSVDATLNKLASLGLQPNLVTFNSLIGAYNRVKPANYTATVQQLYDMVIEAGFQPDGYTVAALKHDIMS